MPELDTHHFGVLRYTSEEIISFPFGIPAFEQEHEFLLLSRSETEPLVFLQSVTNAQLAFVTLPAQAAVADYQLSLAAEERAALNLPADKPGRPGDELLCLAIVTLGEDGLATANLRAPVVIDPVRRRGIQVIHTSSPYSAQHPLEGAHTGADRANH